ncbi:hypothetical protein DICVIV_05599 [Dictyocaulus viviparus]|uniref:Uncharacterized protein n=1 Tax=Dictyocaulus viviparus TaxID=29172 RepID=A0A0D8XUW6_DICVI|nr:hypothetical protein DICVIV_05599 [Dictyocaulus viviparus]
MLLVSQKSEAVKPEQNSERTDDGCSLGADNPQIKLVLAETIRNECTEDYIMNLEIILDTACTYMWSMKKHMAADEAAWRELAKRITLLNAEGYDVRAGTKEAKLRRLSTAKHQSSLMEKVTKRKRKKIEDGE